ncbi:hypothetical protein GOODEAATRI_015646 [Goodea atripinnis]|uniref:Uncharacterized protein n=1 Tax=Goodea atripinnis TaxID=208336 RepID=A0ABV0MSG1_9TELE
MIIVRPLYCRINLSVPVLIRFVNQEDIRPDFWLSSAAQTVEPRSKQYRVTLQRRLVQIWLLGSREIQESETSAGVPQAAFVSQTQLRADGGRSGAQCLLDIHQES